MKLEKTKALAEIYNSITQEIESETYQFKINANALRSAKNDFCVEMDYNILNFNKELIINRLRYYFSDSYEIDFDDPDNDMDDEAAELLSEYNDISKIVFDYLMTDFGFQVYRKLAEKKQKRNAIISKLTNKQPQQITIQENVLDWLQEKGFIENTTAKPLKWLKSKQLARELLTHDKIKVNLTIAEVERQTPNIFIDENNNPLTLAKNKAIPSIDSDNLSKFLATL